ncbi:MAG TPA: toast rack family protein [Candidatus Aquilonibacter sp.]|nr:toast rack family protein [Candidatus Aquilonibacter sp.]
MSTTGGPQAGGMETGPTPGPQPGHRRGRSMSGPIVLIGIGVLFLLATLRPEFSIWWVLTRYWPLILIFIGLGQIWDHFVNRGSNVGISGGAIAFILLLAALIAAGWNGRDRGWAGHGWYWGHDWGDHRNWEEHVQHETQSVDGQGAKRVSANVNIPAGSVSISDGSSHLLDAAFDYDDSTGKPAIDYSVSGDLGTLNVTQGSEDDTHWGNRVDEWNLKFGGGVPLDLRLDMGAGESHLDVTNIDLSRLDVHVGAGEMHLDLRGPRKNDVDVNIQGGVGSATIQLPKDVGVRVNASGGIGSIDARGLQRDGDAYINAAYGKSPATINLTVSGGVGQIVLEE